MPGKKDYISIKVSGVKIHEQKWLLLCNLKELYSYFKNSHPGAKQSRFFEFCILASQKRIMASASGTHSVCVCTIHQNVKLKLEACKISKLTRSSEHHLFLCDCSECPKTTDIEDTLEDVFSDNAIENITFSGFQQTSVN
jgi:hypothetical protein